MTRWADTLDVLVRERGPALFGYAYVLTGNVTEAEDLLQDAILRTFRSGRGNRSLDSAHAYVKRAITTGFVDRGRRLAVRPRRAHGDSGDIDANLQASTSPDLSEATGAALDLHAAILTLPPRERACIVLRYLEDLPIAGVAAELGLAPGTVKRYLADAVAKLRLRCADTDFDESGRADGRVEVVSVQQRKEHS